MRKTTCGWSGCTAPVMNPETKRYCLAHHAEYMREWRKTHPLTDAQKIKDTARHIAGVYMRRGKLPRKPCEKCGTEVNVEKHHDDYTKPLDVHWLCRPCHVALHIS